MKRRTPREINLDEHGNMRIKLQSLKYMHFMNMFQEEYAAALTEERNLLGWQKEGILLVFNRNDYWNLLNESTTRYLSLESNLGSSSNVDGIQHAT